MLVRFQIYLASTMVMSLVGDDALAVCQPRTLLESDKYLAPALVTGFKPAYPKRQARRSNGGRVHVEYMVDKQGRTYDPIVTFSNHPNFESAAIAAVKKYEYKPAQYEGLPVDANSSMRMVFTIIGEGDDVNQTFYHYYKRAVEEFESNNPNKKKIEILINKMQNSSALSAYAHTRLNLIRLQYAMLYGSVAQKIRAAESVLLSERGVNEKNKAIDPRQQTNFRIALFRWYVTVQHYNDALRTYHFLKLDDQVRDEERANLTSAAEKICAIRDDDKGVVKTQFEIGRRGFSIQNMFKNTLSFDGVSGKLTSIKFRCERAFKELPLDLNAEYRIPKSWGACDAQIIGEPDTIAILYQY